MKTKTTILIILMSIGIRIYANSTSSEIKLKEQQVNLITGDISFIQKFGKTPEASTNEKLRLITHLEWVENVLRKKEVSCLPIKLQARRTEMLNLLHTYWTAGVFPKNYDYPGERKSCFIDKNGNICAVGYLVAKTAGMEAAEKINKRYKYDKIKDMQLAELDQWIANSGLTKEECGMIQPTYGFPTGVDSLAIFPANPVQGDEVKLLAFNTRFLTPASSQVNNSSNPIIADFYVQGGVVIGSTVQVVDTVSLGFLSNGNYSARFNLYTRIQTTDSTQQDFLDDYQTITFSVASSTGINNNSINSRISVYPNPSTGNLFLKNIPADMKELIFYSVTGSEIKRIKMEELASNYEINCSEFVPGVYILSAISELNPMQLHKFVIAKK